VPLDQPLRLCPHARYLLYRAADGSTWCFCDVTPDPAHLHLNHRMQRQKALWDELGRLKEADRG
jgi:hypothetical protein